MWGRERGRQKEKSERDGARDEGLGLWVRREEWPAAAHESLNRRNHINTQKTNPANRDSARFDDTVVSMRGHPS